MKTYQDLAAHFSAITSLKQIDSILDWDRSVMMPKDGIDLRARQTAVLNVKIHDMLADARVGDALAAIDDKNLDDWQRANVRLMREQHLLATAVPADVIARKIAQETRTEMIWRQAKADNNFALVAPELEKLFSLVGEYAQARADKLGVPAYDALMVHYLPGMTSAQVDVIFDDLAIALPKMLDQALAVQQDPLPLTGPFDIAKQKQAADLVARQLGFDLDRWGRLDASAHPFSTGIGGDVRITTRYEDSNFINALQAVGHEVGHGMFDHHVPDAWNDQPVGISGHMGMGIHESQSLGLEMQMGRSRAYWDYLAPHLAKIFGGSGPAWSGDNLHRHATHVSRSLIRIEADEITYPLHVILRYRLEKDMLAGKLAVRDLPDAWRAGLKSLVGIEPPTDRQGCLQDIHWHAGMVGYFPAYAIGAVIAAQFTQKLKQDMPDLDARVRGGDFFAYSAWMREHVQSQACLYRPDELIARVTGAPLSATALKEHLAQRYLVERTAAAA